MDTEPKPPGRCKQIIKTCAITAAALIGLWFLACIVFAMNVHTGNDRNISLAIHTEFKAAVETNLNRQLDTALNTLRNETVIYVKSGVSDDEKKELETIARYIGAQHSNRTIRIVYGTPH